MALNFIGASGLAILVAFAGIASTGCAREDATLGEVASSTGATSVVGSSSSSVVGAGGGGGACAALTLDAELTREPLDIVMVVDNSGSMVQEVDAIEQNISANFADIIAAAGVDARVIMVTDHGLGGVQSTNICISPPLSGTTDCSGPPVAVPGRFYHYDVPVDSTDSVCVLFNSLYGARKDEWSLAPGGWSTWLRPRAFKIFIAFTDENDACLEGPDPALDFDRRLKRLSPAHFGSVDASNYAFYSVVGLAEKTDGSAYEPNEPVMWATCPSAPGAGPHYQAISILTRGLRFPVCSHATYDAVFQDIASRLVEVSAVPCMFDVPQPPEGRSVDLDTLLMVFTAGDGDHETWSRVPGLAQCDAGSFYIDTTTAPGVIHLCPEACDAVESDGNASLSIELECGFIIE